MTDKQIIIDGVDVSGCPHYIHKDGSCSSQDCECIKCVHNVCFYKDYKAKEQECEELKETLAEIKEIAEECYYECNSMNNCNISCKYYNDCNGEFSYLLAYLNKQISECEVEE